MSQLVFKSAVRDYLEGFEVSSQLYEAVDEEVADLLEGAAQRAEANGRQTVMPEDL